MKEISSMDFPQHGEGFYFYGQALQWTVKKTWLVQIKIILHIIKNYF
jgi:hypothetical protein